MSQTQSEEQQIQFDVRDKEKRCKSIDGFKFCLFLGSGNRQHEVLYYTHGVLMDGYDWLANQSYRKFRNELGLRGEGVPTVISVSHGSVWLLTSKNSRPLSGLLDVWNVEFLEKIEKAFELSKPPRRLLIGDSMGGHNALKIFNRLPETFDKIAVLCPAQLDFSPYLDWQEIHDNISQGGGVWATHMAVVGLMSTFYDEKAWQSESPFYFSQEFFSRSARIQVVVTENDMYGFTKANESWIDQAKSKGHLIDFHIEPGSHCVPHSMKMVADFLK